MYRENLPFVLLHCRSAHVTLALQS